MLDESQREARFAALMQRRPAVRAIVRHLVAGATRKAIACHLQLSPHTVDWHLRRLYHDLDIGSVAQLTVLWERFDRRRRG